MPNENEPQGGRNIMPPMHEIAGIDMSKAWEQFRQRQNQRTLNIMETSFADGKIGHRCSRPLTGKETRMILWALELHPGPIFSDGEGRVIGAYFCACGPCVERTSNFVIQSGIDLRAQTKGDYHFTRTSDTSVDMELCLMGVFEERQQRQIAELAANVAQQVAAQVSAQITLRVKNEVDRQLGAFFASQRKEQAKARRKDMLIAESFRQQSEMDREYYASREHAD
jgi:hypothetical protein